MNQWIARLAAAVALMLGVAATAQTASYPIKPIRMIVPHAAGGGLDSVARLVAQAMSVGLGQPIVVENKPGSGGMMGAEFVAKSPPDGYTLLMAGNPELVINPTLIPGARYNVARDFTAVMLVAESPNLIVASPSFKGSLREIMDNSLRGQGPITVGTGGTGTPHHLSLEVLRSMGKADFIHVPYKGSGPAVIDVLGGQTQLAISGAPPLMPHIKSGKLRPLAVTQPTRSTLLPDIPTVEEASGIKGMDAYTTWYGLLAPAGTPPRVVEVLEKSIASVLSRTEIRAKVNEMGSEVVALPAAPFDQRMKTELKRYETVIRRFHVKPD